MKHRTMPRSKDKLSILGFGCMRFPTDNQGRIDEDKSFAILHEAYQSGVNYFDTAWGYHNEESEPFLGRFLTQIERKKVFVATKLPCWLVNSREDMDDFLDKQLARLQTDYVDYYLLHALNKRTWQKMKELGVLEFLSKAKQDGKIRYAGFSFHDDYATFSKITRAWDWDFTQIMLNYLDTHYQAGIRGLRLAASRDMGVISMEPLRGGKLVHQIPEEVEEVWQKAKNNESPLRRALKWVWSLPECKVLLSGMSSLEQLRENIQESSNAKPNLLSDKELRVYQKARKAYLSRIPFLCSECRYCMPCPHEVAIPSVLGQYSEAMMFGNYETNKKEYLGFIPEEKRADKCIECEECLSKCPQQIDIPQWMKTIATHYEEI